ncbi:MULTISPECIES: TetR/AcrR family transcriptional regulator [unclassified Streptomyces]|uniref:TetR/AcrR family transcriptional regulator n=1 Tax=unclassified Streptomyces TaxID=2593676 RepID=UPI00037650F4|nr:MULTISPECIES: TetR/AcrR family transcriptional regulator [unclassified Streptomyces]MYQ76826.1 TetR family transcriptional regulator [Streptomyces sp. SID4923]OKI91999.1 transcriptional regulator [Streptomyces sp. CB01249]
MVKQDRALRTRTAIIRAAAVEFGQSGYDGTSLARISKTAGVSMGSLGFHFVTKAEMADAIQEEGGHLIRALVEQVTVRTAPPLTRVADLALDLVRLLETEPSVRATARLARERAAPSVWPSSWLSAVQDLLTEAHTADQLRNSALPGDVTSLVEHLINGAEAHLYARPETEHGHEGIVRQLERVWNLALTGVSREQLA